VVNIDILCNDKICWNPLNSWSEAKWIQRSCSMSGRELKCYGNVPGGGDIHTLDRHVQLPPDEWKAVQVWRGLKWKIMKGQGLVFNSKFHFRKRHISHPISCFLWKTKSFIFSHYSCECKGFKMRNKTASNPFTTQTFWSLPQTPDLWLFTVLSLVSMTPFHFLQLVWAVLIGAGQRWRPQNSFISDHHRGIAATGRFL